MSARPEDIALIESLDRRHRLESLESEFTDLDEHLDALQELVGPAGKQDGRIHQGYAKKTRAEISLTVQTIRDLVQQITESS